MREYTDNGDLTKSHRKKNQFYSSFVIKVMIRIVTGLLLAFMICLIVLFYYQTPELLLCESGEPGPTVLVVGGTHGNEPAGSVAAYQLQHLLQHRLQRGTVIIIPNANKWGLHVNLRFLPAELLSFGLLGKPDLNRSYAHRGEEARTVIAKEIQELALQADWVVDLHEGYDFHKLNPNSMGSGIYPGKSEMSHLLTDPLLHAVNQTIKNLDYQFVTKEWPDEKGTLRMFCDENDIHYTLVETSGQDNIQPLDIRVQQHLSILRALLHELKMI